MITDMINVPIGGFRSSSDGSVGHIVSERASRPEGGGSLPEHDYMKTKKRRTGRALRGFVHYRACVGMKRTRAEST